MTYASFAALRAGVAEKNNQPVMQEAELTPLNLSQIGGSFAAVS
jgi:hypothetical protein